MKNAYLIASLFGLFGAVANAHPYYELKLTNTSGMPISGGVVYLVAGQEGASAVGQMPTTGFVALCQTGNSTAKYHELKSNSKVTFVAQTPGPILPGSSLTVEIPWPRSRTESLHFEAMYGKSKEACASVAISSQTLMNLPSAGEVMGRDDVVVAGAFTSPMLPPNGGDQACSGAATPEDCLRDLSSAKTGPTQIGYFPGYLPSVLNYLENRYGAVATEELLIPSAGAVHYSLQIK